MQNCNELRKRLTEVWDQLEKKEIKHSEAAEFANIAGKMIGSVKVQIEYYGLRKEKPSITFLKERA